MVEEYTQDSLENTMQLGVMEIYFILQRINLM
jgi:hypothetical protein